jgi:acetyl-CoA carboxylase biotin carboxyl carrier protein
VPWSIARITTAPYPELTSRDELQGAAAEHLCRSRSWITVIGCVGRPHYPPGVQQAQEAELPEVEAHITGTVWKVEVEVGDNVQEGDTVVILESMKMEMPVEAEDPGVVKEIRCTEGQSVSEGDTLVVLV